MDGPLSLEDMLNMAEEDAANSPNSQQGARNVSTPSPGQNEAEAAQKRREEARSQLPSPFSSINSGAPGSAKTKKRKLSGTNFYAVKKGRTPGVYSTWGDTQAEIIGFSGALYRKFSTYADAEKFVKGTEASPQSGDFRAKMPTPKLVKEKLQRLNGTGNGKGKQQARPTTAESINLDEFTALGEDRENLEQNLVNGIEDKEGNALLRSFGLVKKGNMRPSHSKRIGLDGIRLHDPNRPRPGPGPSARADGRPGPSRAAGGGRDNLSSGASASRSSLSSGAAGPAELSGEQDRVIREILTGRNVFVTGGAGVGKSFIVERIRKVLKDRGMEMAICASTGIAAVHVGGQTLHSFAGLPIENMSKESIAEDVYKKTPVRNRYKKIQVLLMDEISMVSGKILDIVDFVAKRCRGTEMDGKPLFHSDPMGGIQIIAVGDFFQLPPVKLHGGFAFESAAWRNLNFVSCVMSRIWRQSDPTFANILNEIRLGRVSGEALRKLQECERPLPTDDGILPTILHPHRNSVDSENKKFFDALEGAVRSYECSDYANNNQAKKFLRQLDKTNVHPILETKSRMQVMLTTNLNVSSGLCNGSRGVLLGYKKFSAWYGGVDKEDMNRRYTEQGTSRIAQWGRKNFLLPFVLFSNGQKVTIGPHILTCKFDNGKLSVSRIQIPLIPAWSITIHKSQGMSLDRVDMNLKSVFGAGMAYVALSRARSLDGLKLAGFSRNSVQCSKKVTDFYRSITSNSNNGGAGNGVSNPNDNNGGEGCSTHGGVPMGWSKNLEDDVYQCVDMNLRSALKSAMSANNFDIHGVSNAFKAVAASACDAVVAELLPKLGGYKQQERDQHQQQREQREQQQRPWSDGEARAALSRSSAGALKRFLDTKGVDLRGCVEKTDLVNRALSLPSHLMGDLRAFAAQQQHRPAPQGSPQVPIKVESDSEGDPTQAY